MKTINMNQKILPLAFMITSLLQSCSTNMTKTAPVVVTEVALNTVYNLFPIIGYNNYSSDSHYTLLPLYQNFKKKKNSEQSFIIANMIAVVQPELNEEERDEIAVLLASVSKKYKIKPEILVAIIDTESNFSSKFISSTGDLSMAQINVDMWNREFARMKLPLIDREKVQIDLEYSFTFMAQILNIIKHRFQYTDPQWFARYHSGTPIHKNNYFQKLALRLELMERSENLRNQIAQIQNLELLAPPKFSDKANDAVFANNYVQAILTPQVMQSREKLFTPVISPEYEKIKFALNVASEVEE